MHLCKYCWVPRACQLGSFPIFNSLPREPPSSPCISQTVLMVYIVTNSQSQTEGPRLLQDCCIWMHVGMLFLEILSTVMKVQNGYLQNTERIAWFALRSFSILGGWATLKRSTQPPSSPSTSKRTWKDSWHEIPLEKYSKFNNKRLKALIWADTAMTT